MKTFQYYYEKANSLAEKYNNSSQEDKPAVQKEIDNFIEDSKEPEFNKTAFYSMLDMLIPDRGLEHPVFGK